MHRPSAGNKAQLFGMAKSGQESDSGEDVLCQDHGQLNRMAEARTMDSGPEWLRPGPWTADQNSWVQDHGQLTRMGEASTMDSRPEWLGPGPWTADQNGWVQEHGQLTRMAEAKTMDS
uniref:Uncharacterized protein n=1 Tax=Sphaerodactylus townsendi TaxID=933632 RepID=A0ACB8G606_9SAUR